MKLYTGVSRILDEHEGDGFLTFIGYNFVCFNCFPTRSQYDEDWLICEIIWCSMSSVVGWLYRNPHRGAVRCCSGHFDGAAF